MQKNLFGQIEQIGLSVNDVALRLNVSSATIRNWIKTGYLVQIKRGVISVPSVQKFEKEIAGNEKLTKRANKLMKDEHDHYALTSFVKDEINGKKWETICEQYEESLSNSYRNKEGIYYTPPHIVKDMLSGLHVSPSITFLDPCCGSGNFVIEAIKMGINPENVYGFDIDANAVEITKKRIFELTGFNPEKNIRVLDFLENATLLPKELRFDYIFTNPPWGKKLKRVEKEKYAIVYEAGKSLDTTSLFYFASKKLLKLSGKLGFLVQEALFNISSFQDTRTDMLSNVILRIVDYDKPFKGLLTKAIAFVLENDNQKKKEKSYCVVNGHTYYRSIESFKSNPNAIINFWADENENEVINHIYNMPHMTLKNNAKWALGIVTGNNAKFCKSTPQNDYIPIYKGSDISKEGIKTPSTFIPSDLSKYQQVAPLELFTAQNKLIYKFISSKLIFFHDNQKRFLLNSANLLIPDVSLGVSCENLADLFNSDFMNWLFRTLFKTHKILRQDLEKLPIPISYFEQHTEFSEKSFTDYLGIIKLGNGTYSIKK